jgi:fructan beta-fructosidase
MFMLVLFCSCGQDDAGTDPRVHFSSSGGDPVGAPAGMIYYDNVYHLFYLHDGNSMKNPGRWGHAVSNDLISWEHKDVVIFPHIPGSVGAGSIVADVRNTSGLGTDGNPPLVAIFTCTDNEKLQEGDIYTQTQCLAYSLDKGDTWTAYEGNPVISNPGISDFRDPKVFWYEPQGYWVMVAVTNGRVGFYTSPDLKSWTHSGDFGSGVDMAENAWERPDLFELSGDDGGERQWILTVSVGMGLYNDWVTGFFAGVFDGKTFVTDQTSPYRMDYGRDNYGGMTISNTGDRRLWIGWLNNPAYADAAAASRWPGAMTIPRSLRLEKTPYYSFVASLPVRERSVLHGERAEADGLVVKQDIHSEGISDLTPLLSAPLTPSEVSIRFRASGDHWLQMGNAEKFGLRLSNGRGEYILAGYDAYHQQFYIDRTSSAALDLPPSYAGVHLQQYPMEESNSLEMQIIIDAYSLEMFAMDGKVVFTERLYPSTAFDRLEVFAENGKVNVENISVTPFKSHE